MSLCSQLKKSVATSWSPSTQPPEFLWKTCTSFEAIPCMRENLLSVFWPITTKLPDRAPKSFSSTAWQVSPWLRFHRGRHVGHTFDAFMKQEIDVVFGHTKLEVSSVSAMSISMYTVVLFSAFIFVSSEWAHVLHHIHNRSVWIWLQFQNAWNFMLHGGAVF